MTQCPDCPPGAHAQYVRDLLADREEDARITAARLDELQDALIDTLLNEDLPVVCDNGCPLGMLGMHKFSCLSEQLVISMRAT
jgi:hypothetical protein